MKKIMILILLLCGVLPVISAQGQQREDTVINVRIRAKVQDHAIKLRWAPCNPRAWLDAKKYGFVLERYTIKSGNDWFEYPEKLRLGGGPLLPEPPEKWSDYAQKSVYAAVIAQAFWGMDFSLSPGESGGFASVINQADELQQRFNTSVFMAENDFYAASMAAWGWKDTLAKAHEKYLYRVYINKPVRSPADSAAVFIGMDDYREPSVPQGLSARFGDRSVMLTWNYALGANEYHSYHIEKKSPEDTDFRRITDLPVTPLSASVQEMFYLDSLEANHLKYVYRIRGVDSFGQTGPCSGEVEGEGWVSANCMPAIISADFTAPAQLTLYWELECNVPDTTNTLRVQYATEEDGLYQTVPEMLHPGQKNFVFPLKEESAYIRICIQEIGGSMNCSLPYFVRRIDSVPPAVPVGLRVLVDSLGVAHLSWQPGMEPDLLGYRVVRSFAENEEMSVLTPEWISASQFTDTLSLQMINRKVFYAVSAIDKRFNESVFCRSVLAFKPDKIPPAEPVFSDYQTKNGSVSLSWITDPEDEAEYALFRRTLNDTLPESLIFTAGFQTSDYTDYPPGGSCYEYRIRARDPSGNTAYSPTNVRICLPASGRIVQVSGFSFYRDTDNKYVELSWNRHPQAIAYKIYKSEQGKPLRLWKESDQSVTKAVDEDIYPATIYQYSILPVVANGQKCKWQTIEVKY